MGCPTEDHIRKQLETIIRPIVEGQVRGFIKEHPSILFGVTWYKRRADKSKTLCGSITKRIVRDLTSAETSGRIVAALLARPTGEPPISSVALGTAVEQPTLARILAWVRRIMFRVEQ